MKAIIPIGAAGLCGRRPDAAVVRVRRQFHHPRLYHEAELRLQHPYGARADLPEPHLRQGLEFDLTRAVVREIEAKTPYKVVGADADADTELTGEPSSPSPRAP